MSCAEVTREIRGRPVYCRQWTASKGLEMQSMLLNTLGDYCLSFVMGDWNFEGLMFILEKCNAAKLELLIKQCCYSVKVDEKQVTASNFDDIFSGDVAFIYETFSFVLQVNFKDFFVEGLAGTGPSQT